MKSFKRRSTTFGVDEICDFLVKVAGFNARLNAMLYELQCFNNNLSAFSQQLNLSRIADINHKLRRQFFVQVNDILTNFFDILRTINSVELVLLFVIVH